MGKISSQSSQQVCYLDIAIKKNGSSSLKNFVLVFFPGKKIRYKGYEKKRGHENKNGPRYFPGTFVLCQFFQINPFFLFGFQISGCFFWLIRRALFGFFL